MANGSFKKHLTRTLVPTPLLRVVVTDKGVDGQAVKVVDTFRLQERPAFDKKQFVTHMKRCIKILGAKLE
ncbi:hypothetical protein VPH35_016990 [Triticum aestivum]|uniref:TCTP domain-containing protein n=1 Tax=Aegilops tauschii subsp. strangulata TaxID=200361 RepID=A0A452ZVC7_AEGTS